MSGVSSTLAPDQVEHPTNDKEGDMPKRTKAEIIADLKAKLAEAEQAEDQSKITKIERLDKEISTFAERIAALENKKQAKVDERDLLQREVDESRSAQPTEPADGSVRQANADVSVPA